jgi:flagellin-specific chaperone FliS
MSPPDRYLRLFDLKKYREIQPITEGINQRDVDTEQAISLINRAVSVVKTENFKKYNDKNKINFVTTELQEGLDILQEGRLSEQSAWYDCHNHGGDKLNTIITLICCPSYQSSEYSKQTSDATLSYLDYYGYLNSFNKDLYNILEINRCSIDSIPLLESLPSDSGNADTWIFDRQGFIELNQIVSQDISALSQLNSILYEISNSRWHINFKVLPKSLNPRDLDEGYEAIPQPEIQSKLLKFYTKFNNLLELANANSDYTIINEVFWW